MIFILYSYLGIYYITMNVEVCIIIDNIYSGYGVYIIYGIIRG